MFNFGERTTGEKVVMIGAGTLLVANTAMNVVNTVKVRNLKKRANMFDERMCELNNSMNAVKAIMASQQQVVQQQPITPPPVVEQPQNQETK